jgi:hypothetical protein
MYQAVSAQWGIHSGLIFNDISFIVAEDLSPPVLAITVHTFFLSLSKIGIAGDHPHSCQGFINPGVPSCASTRQPPGGSKHHQELSGQAIALQGLEETLFCGIGYRTWDLWLQYHPICLSGKKPATYGTTQQMALLGLPIWAGEVDA